jgi:arylsulfatase A-like enzyme
MTTVHDVRGGGTPRPNILVLMTDHTNAQALAPGSPCLTPHLDALAAEGRRFQRCYTPNAICSPARASLMTSLYPSTHGMWDCTHTQRPEWVDVPASRFRYFSQALAEVGYANAYYGKWHVEQSHRLEDFGWHEYEVRACQGAGFQPSDQAESVVVPKRGYRDYLLAGVADVADPRHPAIDHGIDFLHRHAATHTDQPFCLFVSTIEPHDPYVSPRAFFDRYDVDNLPLPDSLHDDLADKPEAVRRLAGVWRELTDAQWRQVRAAYWATITFLDAEFGRLLAMLRQLDLYEDTIIVFTSDHGDMLGAHGLATKGIATSYEEVYNIPLILRVPGARQGVEDASTCTSLVDLAPTLLDYCVAPALPGAQGRSLRPVLEGTADPGDWQSAYGEFFGQRFVYTQRITWHGAWKYVFNPAGIDELYYLAEDPHERVNRADDPACRDILEAMCRRMWEKMAAIGDQSLFNTEYATLRTAPVGPR